MDLKELFSIVPTGEDKGKLLQDFLKPQIGGVSNQLDHAPFPLGRKCHVMVNSV